MSTSEDPYIYAAHSVDDSVSVIDASSDTKISTITVWNHPNIIFYNSISNKMYTTNMEWWSLTVINWTTVTNTISIGTAWRPDDITLDPSSGRMYVSMFNNNKVAIIDTATESEVGSSISVGNNPRWLLYLSDNDWIYVTNSSDDTVSFRKF